METMSVLVEYEDKINAKVYGNSGFLFADKYIIITPNILVPLLKDNDIVQKYFSDDRKGFLNPRALLKTVPRLNVAIEQPVNHNKLIVYKRADVIAMIIDECIKTSADKILRDWAIDYEEPDHQLKEILSLFFILEIDKDGPTDFNHLKSCLYEIWLRASTFKIEIGRKVFVESTPFGNRHFLKSLSRGIVSNVAGKRSSLILTDTPTAPGSEGSPIYIKSKLSARVPIGVVISCLSWWRGEWIGLTLGANLANLIEQIVVPKLHNRVCLEDKTTSLKSKDLLNTVEKSIAQVISGSSWGTAIFLDGKSGLFLTNSHVIENDRPILYWNDCKIESKLIFKTSENGAFDLAILTANASQLNDTTMQPAPISLNAVDKGEKVFAAGFPLFANHLKPKPTLTQGHVSAVDPYMLKTTCSVLPGASGGAILRADGSLIGVIVCNTRMEENLTAYPRVNMSIPLPAIYDTISKFLQTSDGNILDELDVADSTVNNRWNILRGKL